MAFQSTRSPSPQADYARLQARHSLALPNTVGPTPSARFSGNFGGLSYGTSNVNNGSSNNGVVPPGLTSQADRHMSMSSGMNSIPPSPNPQSHTVGERLANARASSPNPHAAAGPGIGLGSAPGSTGIRTGVRPVSEYTPGGRGVKGGKEATPENEAIENWFTDLQAYEAQLDALASASMDQNFTDELQAIESWFRVLSENERTAALYSLLQQSTTAQVRFFQKVLSQMQQSDPVSAILSPALGGGSQQQDTARLGAVGGVRSPAIGAFPTSPVVNQFLAPDGTSGEAFGSPSAQLAAQRNRMKQNRISAPGTLQVSEAGRFLGGQLNDVLERGGSPGVESNASRSPALGAGFGGQGNGMDRPKSTDFSGMANMLPASRSPRPNAGGIQEVVGLGLPNTGLKSPRFEDQFSPMPQGNWASLMNTPMLPMFGGDNNAHLMGGMSQAELATALGNLGLGVHGGNVVLDDAAKFKRRPQNAVVYNDDGEPIQAGSNQPGKIESPRPGGNFNQAGNWRSPLAQQGEFEGANQGLQGLAGLGLGGAMGGMGMEGGNLAGLGMGMGMGMGIGGMGGGMGMANISPNPMLNTNGFAGAQGSWSSSGRQRTQTDRPRKSPMLRQGEKATGGGGAGSGAGVAGENDVDERVLKDVAYWLRVLRLHKYTPNFQGEKWQDMVSMNDAKLQGQGVAALGARRKLLKVFANVRTHYKIPHPEGYLEELGTDDKDKEKDDDNNDNDKE